MPRSPWPCTWLPKKDHFGIRQNGRLVPLYQRLGWRTLEQDVHVEQPEGVVIMPLRTMWTPLRDGANWPAGEVRLLSLPM
ncbi:hypothetical protein [Kitasatospora kifunensis]|uniref:Uncharacterized protein n=1 Tax=Kitasatospora kifunensis TaxID=58351 RepID=A0A7W7RAT2_KITKI|nr:hypothetical protein [Kitasatospora kifunensis]MBB4927926.1 hypothetical protein [Kitasatospora kifunensis]